MTKQDIISNVIDEMQRDYDRLEARIITMKNEKTRVVFKVNGEVTSLYK